MNRRLRHRDSESTEKAQRNLMNPVIFEGCERSTRLLAATKLEKSVPQRGSVWVGRE
jgi:hypothetical protein